MATVTNALFSFKASGKVGNLYYRQNKSNQEVWENRFSEGTGIEAGNNKEQARFKIAANAWTKYLTNGLIRISWFKYETFFNKHLNPYARYMACALSIPEQTQSPTMANLFTWDYAGNYSWNLVNLNDGSSNIEHGTYRVLTGIDYMNLTDIGSASTSTGILNFSLTPRPSAIYFWRIEKSGIPRCGNCRSFVQDSTKQPPAHHKDAKARHHEENGDPADKIRSYQHVESFNYPSQGVFAGPVLRARRVHKKHC